jgi:hypothetical protein
MAVIPSGGGGGGSGTTKYATEVQLLAATPAAGTQAYAEDTSNFWYRRGATWQKIPNFDVLRRDPGVLWGEGVTIYMDAATGDDAGWNDGTVTPLRTIQALLDRLPAKQSGGGWAYVIVQFGPGDYELSQPYGSSIDLIGNVAFQGSWSAASGAFTIDSITGSNCHLNKPAGDDPWVVDAYAKQWVEVLVAGFPCRFPILANGTHDLTIGIPSVNPWNGVSPGDTAHIVMPTTRFTGPGYLQLNTVGALYISDILWDSSPTSGGGYIYWNGAGFLALANCHFKCAASGGSGIVKVLVGAYLYVANTLIEDGNGFIFDTYGDVEFRGVSAINCGRLMEMRYSRVVNQGVINTRNTGTVFFPAYGCELIDRYGWVQCLGNDGIWMLQNRGCVAWLLSGVHALDGKPPSNLVYLVPGCHAYLGGTSDEASTPANSIIIQGAVIVNFSYADFINLYGGDYDFGSGAQVTKI